MPNAFDAWKRRIAYGTLEKIVPSKRYFDHSAGFGLRCFYGC